MKLYRHPLSVLCLCLAISLFTLSPQAFAESGTLVYSWSSNVGPLNPHAYSPNQMFAQAMVYEPLVRYGMGGKILPCLAESWETTPDRREYTFHLRKGVQFSDGTPFDAEAVKKNHDTLIANAKSHNWLELARQIQETVVLDEHTVKVVLKESYYPFLQDLALIRPFRYLSPSAFPESGNTKEGIKAAIGTGPWVLTQTRLGQDDTFERNDRYWGPRPDLAKIIVKVLPDPNTRAMAFETGEIDLIYGDGQISLDTFNRFRNNPAYTTRMSQPLASRCIVLNSGRGPTRELAVRKAIQHAVNKEALIRGVFLNTEIKADTLYASNTPYCDLNLPPYEYSLSKAKKLLDLAGWKTTDKASVRTRDGKELTMDLCFIGNNAVMKSISEVFQADLQKIGIRVVLKGEETDSYYKRQHQGEFDLIFNDSWGPPYDPHSFMSSWRAPSHADYQAQSGLPMKKQIDEAIGEVLVSRDEFKRQALYREILGTLHAQAVYLPISYTTGLMVHRADVSEMAYGATKYEIPFETIVQKQRSY
ncbi:nickel ABC transporter substrate-binding protein [Desulfoluna sp.]|uniref:nickel ABC transporter substrate-binding protein n=1 Tax=Desulfoluna sp. TaxID=2045199 RepID=UPI002610D066|nr:nickel ABC transporter substrate-binding protein [Desulfoluna sp.]